MEGPTQTEGALPPRRGKATKPTGFGSAGRQHSERDRQPDAYPPSSEGGRPPQHTRPTSFFGTTKPGGDRRPDALTSSEAGAAGRQANRRFGDGRQAGPSGHPLLGGRRTAKQRPGPNQPPPRGRAVTARAPTPRAPGGQPAAERRPTSVGNRKAAGQQPPAATPAVTKAPLLGGNPDGSRAAATDASQRPESAPPRKDTGKQPGSDHPGAEQMSRRRPSSEGNRTAAGKSPIGQRPRNQNRPSGRGSAAGQCPTPGVETEATTLFRKGDSPGGSL